MRKNKKIMYIDMDGVLTNFIGGCEKVFDTDLSNMASWKIEQYLGITEEEFWYKINEGGYKFWSELEPYEDYKLILQTAHVTADEVYILTSPSISPNCSKGKMMWIQEHIPYMQRKVILTPNKHLLSKHNTVLIDDSQYKVDKFNKYGEGYAIMYPRPWNGNAYSMETFLTLMEESFDSF